MDVSRAGRIEQFRRLCEAKGLSVTHQRQVIYEALMRMHGHPTPETIYAQVRRRIPSISLATVYKNIKIFVDSGLLKEVSLHHGLTRLETNMTPHHHLVCAHCRTIVDLQDGDLEPAKLKVPAPEGFLVERYSVDVIGVCGKCAGRS